MRARSTTTKLIAASFCFAALAAACGDDDSGEAGGGTPEEWCAALDLGAEGDAVMEGLTASSPEQVEAGMQRMEQIVDDLEAAAPPEIADDVSFLASYTRDISSALADADYVLFDTDLSAFADQEQQLDEVQASIDEYTVQECGQPFGDDDSADASTSGDDAESGDFDPEAGTIREQLVTQFVTIGFTQDEAECIADGVDPTDADVLSGDEQAIIALFEACDIPPSRLAELGG